MRESIKREHIGPALIGVIALVIVGQLWYRVVEAYAVQYLRNDGDSDDQRRRYAYYLSPARWLALAVLSTIAFVALLHVLGVPFSTTH